VRRLHAGSWIYASFSTWIGGPQKNRVWTLLAELRQQIRQALADSTLSDERRREVEACLHAAEGSDWFWWLDGQYESDYVVEFDRLQRAHLARAFALLELPVPAALNASLASAPEQSERPALEPPGFISPELTGAEGAPLDWRDALRLRWLDVRPTGSMQRGSAPFESLWLGFSRERDLLLRLDPTATGEPLVPGLRRLRLVLQRSDDVRELSIDLDEKGALRGAQLEVTSGSQRLRETPVASGEVEAAWRDFLAVRASGELLALAPGATLRLQIGLHGAGGELALRPLHVRVPAAERRRP
jgi:hypothetical protein